MQPVWPRVLGLFSFCSHCLAPQTTISLLLCCFPLLDLLLCGAFCQGSSPLIFPAQILPSYEKKRKCSSSKKTPRIPHVLVLSLLRDARVIPLCFGDPRVFLIVSRGSPSVIRPTDGCVVSPAGRSWELRSWAGTLWHWLSWGPAAPSPAPGPLPAPGLQGMLGGRGHGFILCLLGWGPGLVPLWGVFTTHLVAQNNTEDYLSDL